MKIFDPGPEQVKEQVKEKSEYARPPAKRRPKNTIPRCHCGCGKIAEWPRNGPLFHSREHGYNLACRMILEQKESM